MVKKIKPYLVIAGIAFVVVALVMNNVFGLGTAASKLKAPTAS